MFRERLDRPLVALVVLILFGTGFSTYRNWARLREEMAQGQKMRGRLTAATELLSQFKDAETGQRGYLVTGAEEYLTPYTAAVAAIPGLLDQATAESGNDPVLAADSELLRRYAREKLVELAWTISLRREKGFEAALPVVRSNKGKAAMDAIRGLVAKMGDRETGLLKANRSASAAAISRIFWLTAAGLVVMLAAIVMLKWAVDRAIRTREQLAGTLDKAQVIIQQLDGTILYWNSGAEAMYGWSRAEALAHNGDALLATEFSEPVEEIQDQLRRQGSWRGEYRQRRRDGSMIWIASKWVLERDLKGEPVSIVQVNNDITELKNTADALRISNATVRSLFESASQGIVAADAEGRVVESNSTMETLFGYGRGELIGVPLDALLPKQEGLRQMGQGMDLMARRKDGGEFPVEVRLSFLEGSQSGGQAVAFVSDITVRKEEEREREALIAKLEAGLAERTVLMKEVHHRVKNNLAVIIGLLGMQSYTVRDERLTAALEKSQQRVASMALIHEFLYATNDMDKVNFGDYVQQLSSELCASYSIDADTAAVEVEADQIELPVHRAIPCGLILNELLSNALKYAFPNSRRGKIDVRFVRLESGELSLSCRDDGVGIPENFDWRNSKSMGLKIIQILTKQLHGELTLDRLHSGTRFELKFADRRPHG